MPVNRRLAQPGWSPCAPRGLTPGVGSAVLSPVNVRIASSLALLCLGGCKDESEAIPVEVAEVVPIVARLDVRDRTPRARHPAPGVSQAQIRRLVRQTLRGDNSIEVPEADVKPDRASTRPTYRAVVEMTLSRQSAPGSLAKAGIGTAHVYIQMDRIAGGDGIESHGAEASSDRPVPTSEEGPNRFWLDLLEDATSQAFHVVVVQVAARKRDIVALQDDLAAEDVAVRQEAVRELGRRGETSALDAIAALLDDPHQDVVLASVGALTNLRDPRAGTALIASTRGRSNEYLVTVIGALRTIGGVEAEAYLDALATGHPRDDIKSRATRALLDVRARRYSPRRKIPPR